MAPWHHHHLGPGPQGHARRRASGSRDRLERHGHEQGVTRDVAVQDGLEPQVRTGCRGGCRSRNRDARNSQIACRADTHQNWGAVRGCCYTTIVRGTSALPRPSGSAPPTRSRSAASGCWQRRDAGTPCEARACMVLCCVAARKFPKCNGPACVSALDELILAPIPPIAPKGKTFSACQFRRPLFMRRCVLTRN